jgi:predicted nuclease of predicted toxin-antitoxin system
MNLSPVWVEYLTAAGHQAEHWSRVGAPDAPDVLVMDYSRGAGSIVITHDLDFGAMLAATGGQTPSVIQLRAARLSPDAIGAQLLTALNQFAAELAAGALLSLDAGRTRVTLLPLPRKP